MSYFHQLLYLFYFINKSILVKFNLIFKSKTFNVEQNIRIKFKKLNKFKIKMLKKAEIQFFIFGLFIFVGKNSI